MRHEEIVRLPRCSSACAIRLGGFTPGRRVARWAPSGQALHDIIRVGATDNTSSARTHTEESRVLTAGVGEAQLTLCPAGRLVWRDVGKPPLLVTSQFRVEQRAQSERSAASSISPHTPLSGLASDRLVLCAFLAEADAASICLDDRRGLRRDETVLVHLLPGHRASDATQLSVLILQVTRIAHRQLRSGPFGEVVSRCEYHMYLETSSRERPCTPTLGFASGPLHTLQDKLNAHRETPHEEEQRAQGPARYQSGWAPQQDPAAYSFLATCEPGYLRSP